MEHGEPGAEAAESRDEHESDLGGGRREQDSQPRPLGAEAGGQVRSGEAGNADQNHSMSGLVRKTKLSFISQPDTLLGRR